MAVYLLQPAPAFEAQAVVGGEFKKIKLADYHGKYVFLFFYPFDFTSVCNSEVVTFSDRIADFEKRGVQLLGCSTDSQYTHRAWKNLARDKGGIGDVAYPIIADLNKQMARDYGVLVESAGFALRGSFLIDQKGVVMHLTINPPPLGRSVDEALRMIDALQHFEKHGETCPVDWKPK